MAGLVSVAVGLITALHHVEEIVARGLADLVALVDELLLDSH
ncbi:hypothetical protein [Bosea sp. BH3]|nr:hypothetical protein [Bosea sp. BH3]